MLNTRFVVPASLVLLMFSGCGFRHDKNAPNANALASEFKSGTIGYEEVRSKIFSRNCVGCHSGRVSPDLNSYNAVKVQIARVEDTVLKKMSMPRKGPLDVHLRGLLQQWIEDGAPEFAREPAQPSAARQ